MKRYGKKEVGKREFRTQDRFRKDVSERFREVTKKAIFKKMNEASNMRNIVAGGCKNAVERRVVAVALVAEGALRSFAGATEAADL